MSSRSCRLLSVFTVIGICVGAAQILRMESECKCGLYVVLNYIGLVRQVSRVSTSAWSACGESYSTATRIELVHIFSMAKFNNEGQLRRTIRETSQLRRGIQQVSRA